MHSLFSSVHRMMKHLIQRSWVSLSSHKKMMYVACGHGRWVVVGEVAKKLFQIYLDIYSCSWIKINRHI